MYKISLSVLFAVLALLVLWPSSSFAQAPELSPEYDPAFCLPGLLEFARQYPTDWERRLDPEIRPMVQWQRIIGSHGVVSGWTNAERVIIHVARWDGADLFALGLPRTFEGRPVEIRYARDIPRATASTGGTDDPIPQPGCAQPLPPPGPADFALANGRFFTQASGQPDRGYAVTDDAGVRFWSEFQRLGGVEGVGYPVSARFVWDGFVSQAFQKMVFQWRPDVGQVYAVNVVDLMHERGLDDWLQVVRATPPIADWSSDTGRSWPEVVAAHQELLTDPDIRAAYFAVDDPVTLYGLPMAPIQNLGNVLVLRAQRGIIQKWLVATPWAAAGQVTIANSGDVAKEAGLLPKTATVPGLPPA